MTEDRIRISHGIVRVVATITLFQFGLAVICARFFQTFCHAYANSWLGTVMTFWAIGTSLLLPVYVGIEGLWAWRSKLSSQGIWIDAILAAACLASLWATVVYALGHSAII